MGSALYGLSLTQIHYESAVLTETLTTFLLVMLAADLTWLWMDRRRYLVFRLAIAGVCAGLVPLARPSYVYVPFVFIAIALVWVPRLRRRPLLIAIVAAIAIAPALAWSSFNFARFDTFGLSTMAGFDLTNKTGGYVADAPARYAVIRDIYVAALKARHGDQRDLIWHVIPAMEAATGESYAHLSKTLMSMNVGLILSHQKEYWLNVASVFTQFWKTTGYDDALPSLGGITHVWWLIHKWFNRLLNVIFLLLAGYWVVRAIARRRWPTISPLEWMAAVTILSGVVCALVIDGSNARFGMPTQPYVVCVVFVVVFSRLSSRPSREKAPVRSGS